MDLAELRENMAYWQRVLRIQDWDVELQLQRHHEIGEGLLGQCIRNDSSRTAKVLLLDPRDLAPAGLPSGRDLEVTLVHELLHVVFHCASSETENRVAFEQAIDSTARALVRLDRGEGVL